jgi:hypothetical protein
LNKPCTEQCTDLVRAVFVLLRIPVFPEFRRFTVYDLREITLLYIVLGKR